MDCRSPDRRTFVKRVAAVAGAAAAGSLVPGTAAGDALGRWVARLGLDWRHAPCALCGVGCGLLVGLEDGRAAAVRGDPDAPVNRGLACARGYHVVQALYGRDRLTTAQVRRDGRLVPVPIGEALDLVARALGDAVAAHGKDSVALYGSGHWSIPAGYVGAKLFKGALGTNNVDSEARLYDGSAVAGALSTFGMAGAVGGFEDTDHADVFVLWGTNMAELHPVLFSRILEQRQRRPGVRIVDVATRTTRTSYPADRALLYAPTSEIALANAIAHEIVARGRANGNFLGRYVAFRRDDGAAGAGGQDAAGSDPGKPVTFEDYARWLDPYTPEWAEGVTGMAAADIRWLAALYAEPGLRVTTLWDDGVNRHARGTWVNNALYNLHLLVGKIAAPGDGPLALGQQASGGTAWEAGAYPTGLPGGSVARAADRERAARLWSVPLDRIDSRPGHHALAMFRALEAGDLRFLWVQGADPMTALPHLGRYRGAVAAQPGFLVVSDAYPTATTDRADVVLPSALWIEAEAVLGGPDRRAHHVAAMLAPPGEALGEAWQLMEVARRLGFARLFPWSRDAHIAAIWEEYRRFRDGPAQALPSLAELRTAPGLAWPYVDGRETRWRYNTRRDPAADAAHGDYDFYGHPDHRARIWLRPYEAPPEAPDPEFPLWLTTGGLLEHAATGTLTRRIPTLHRAVPAAYAEVSRADADRLGISSGDRVRLVTRRGSLVLEARVDHRSQPPAGQVFVPSFDEALPINTLTLDELCPASGQPTYTCAVRVERIPPGSAS